MKFFNRRQQPAPDSAPPADTSTPPAVPADDQPTSDAVATEPSESTQLAQQDHDGALVLRAELPGLDAESEIAVTVADGMLLVEAEQRRERHTEADGYQRHELRVGAIRQSVPLPPDARPDDIVATYQDGVLEIRIPRSLNAVRKIPIATR
jgi:HSP20 family molecular chaperone IbpA